MIKRSISIALLFTANHYASTFQASGAFLWWQPNDSAIEFADVVTEERILGIASSSSGQPQLEKKYLHLDWAPGFRIDLSYGQECWDGKLDWTWYKNHTKKTIQSPTDSATNINTGLSGTENGCGIYAPWLDQWIPSAVSTFIDEVPVQLVYPGPFANAEASMHLFYTTVDAESGYHIGCGINNIRFFFGARGAIIDRSYNACYSCYANLGSLLTFYPTNSGFSSGSFNGELDFWGVGPRLGIYDELSWACGMQLFGQFSGALLYGPLSGHETTALYDKANNPPALFGGKRFVYPDHWISAGNIQTLLGLGWKKEFTNFLFGISAAWESNMWFMNSHNSLIYPHGADLNLNGLTVTVQLGY